MGGRNTTQQRRLRILIGSVTGALILAVVVGIIVFAGSDERIDRFQIDAAVQPDGSTLVREVIDYDFGSSDKHGIFRIFPGYVIGTVPGPTTITDLSVRSDSAPDDLDISSGEVRVGSPNLEVSGRNTYEISYRLPPTAGLVPGQVALDIVGTQWQVPIAEVSARIELPADLLTESCVVGHSDSTTPCEGFATDERVLTVNEDDLGDHEGITVYATAAPGGEATALPPAPELRAGDSQWYITQGIGFAVLTLLAYLAGLLPVTVYSRWLGRDWAWHGGGGAVDAVFGGPGLEARRISDKTAEGQVTIQFVPPPDLTPAQGGLVLREKVTDDHRVAWLMDYSLSGWISIGNGGKQLSWTANDDRWGQAPTPLRIMFAGRHFINLSKYDEHFAKGWKRISDTLNEFKSTSGLWDTEAAAKARRRSTIITWIAIPVVIVAAIAAVLLFRAPLPVLGVIGGVLGLAFGAGLAAIANRGELDVRTAKGFSQRQLTEGFRRFFQTSETRHVVEAANRDQLRLYTAWAIALDEVDNWDRMIRAADLPSNTKGMSDVAYMSTFASSTHTATTAPSSSGSGGGGSSGGGGGGVGGGGGGGGGGSW